jgi:hypothetical protein
MRALSIYFIHQPIAISHKQMAELVCTSPAIGVFVKMTAVKCFFTDKTNTLALNL